MLNVDKKKAAVTLFVSLVVVPAVSYVVGYKLASWAIKEVG